MIATMEIFEDSFIKQPIQRSLHAYFYLALYLSVLFHLVLYTVFKHIEFTPDSITPAEISTLIVKLVTHEPITAEPNYVPPAVTGIPVPIVMPDEQINPVEQITDQPLLPDLVTPATIEDEEKQPDAMTPTEESYPDAESLIEQSYNAAKTVAKEMESLVKSTDVFDPHSRQKLETARRQQIIDKQTAKRPTENLVVYNQRGDLLIRSGGNCLIVPSELMYFVIFNKSNSILAVPDPSCSKPKKNFLFAQDSPWRFNLFSISRQF